MKQQRSKQPDDRFQNIERDLKELERLCAEKVSDVEHSLVDRMNEALETRFDLILNRLADRVDKAINDGFQRQGLNSSQNSDTDVMCKDLRDQARLKETKLRREIETLNEKVQQDNNEITQLKHELNDANTSIKGFCKKDKTVQDQNGKLQRDLDESKRENESMAKEIDKLRMQLGKLH